MSKTNFDRKLFVTVVCLIVVISLLPIVPMKVSASLDKTQADAIDWITQRGNERWAVDYDNAYGVQCVDLIKYYYNWLGGFSTLGNAKTYYDGTCTYNGTTGYPDGWYADTNPAPGSIIAFGAYGDSGIGSNGHVGLVYSVSGTTVYTVETNYTSAEHDGDPNYAYAKFITRNNPSGCVYIHPDFAIVNGIERKMNSVLTVYPTGSYFTVASSSSGCTSSNHDTVNGNWCYGCYLPNIPARGGLPSGAEVNHEADTCCGFASYVFYCIFGHSKNVNTTVKSSGPVFGDMVFTGSHWFIYLSEDSSNYYVYDANGYNGAKNKVIYDNYYPKSAVSSLTVYHANNYDEVSGTNIISWASIPDGEYYLVQASSGKQLDVSGGVDANNTNVQIHEANDTTAQKWAISASANGYKIKPLCTVSRVLNSYGTTVNVGNNVNLWDSIDDNTQRWLFEPVNGGYIIHNAGNINCVLDVVDGSNVFLNIYNPNSTTEVWRLESVDVNTPLTIQSISVYQLPNKYNYQLGEPFNPEGLVLEVLYSNNQYDYITDGFTVSGFDSSTPGTKTITVEYSGATTEFTVTAQAPQIDIVTEQGSKRITINNFKEYTISIDGDEDYFTTEVVLDLDFDAHVVLTAEDSTDFAYWRNSANVIVSREPEFEFYVTTAETYTAVYNTKARDKVTVVFESLFDQVISRTQLTLSGIDSLVMPAGPNRFGYTFTGWQYGISEIRTIAAAALATTDISDDVIIVKPVYVINSATKSITVINGTGTGNYAIETSITVTPNTAPAGQKFSHWINGSGTIVSYRPDYTFFVMTDETLTAVYVDQNAVVTPTGIATIMSIVKDTDNRKISFASFANVPNGFTIKNAGVIATSEAAIGSDAAQFTTENAMYVRGSASASTSSRFIWTKSNVGAETWYVRAFITYSDTSGNTFTIYGDIVSASLNIEDYQVED